MIQFFWDYATFIIPGSLLAHGTVLWFFSWRANKRHDQFLERIAVALEGGE